MNKLYFKKVLYQVENYYHWIYENRVLNEVLIKLS